MATTVRHRIEMWAPVIALCAVLTAADLFAQGPAPAGNRPDSIGVHGAWVIDVRNPDGSLATHREFENALQDSGASALVSVLSGANAFGPMLIWLNGSTSPCSGTTPLGGAFPVPCIITPSASAQSQPTGALVLTGVATATANGTIDNVSTVSQTTCGAGPAPCGPVNPQFAFTAFGFAGSTIAPIQVVVGQVIQVTVTLSFS